ncbi:hypothetical protein GCM10022276_03900 [Sphingomonas limnosediminicola]|uniref:Uncharacterized protein n=1 Tax=Sphingomonas limnosediminicola TaxID=940133 RepID=A0ABP7KX90_9SPHN
MTRAKPRRTDIGVIVGIAVGVLIWWTAYDPRAGLLQNLQLIIVPAAFGVVVVTLRNRWKKVGPYDPETIERNKRGVV